MQVKVFNDNYILITDCMGFVQYIGDGYCDDENNNEMCEFDQGDCCLEEVKTDFCTDCICYEGNSTMSTTNILF